QYRLRVSSAWLANALPTNCLVERPRDLGVVEIGDGKAVRRQVFPTLAGPHVLEQPALVLLPRHQNCSRPMPNPCAAIQLIGGAGVGWDTDNDHGLPIL